jgi:hypothetical protein
MSDDKNNASISGTIPMMTAQITASVWTYQTFAHEWFNDALHETQNASGYNSTRREIIFAVAFAESYLFEWLRDDILKKNYNKLSTYYHLFYNQSPIEKWKEIPKKLYNDGLIPNIPKIENIKQEWDEFKKVVKYRNGLSHGASSIPKNLSLSSEISPTPPIGELHKKKPGWAIKTIMELIKQFHKAANMPAPEWLQIP